MEYCSPTSPLRASFDSCRLKRSEDVIVNMKCITSPLGIAPIYDYGIYVDLLKVVDHVGGISSCVICGLQCLRAVKFIANFTFGLCCVCLVVIKYFEEVGSASRCGRE